MQIKNINMNSSSYLLAVEVELMLGDGALPDALGQPLRLAEPHVHVDVARVHGAPGHAHLRITSFLHLRTGHRDC